MSVSERGKSRAFNGTTTAAEANVTPTGAARAAAPKGAPPSSCNKQNSEIVPLALIMIR